jgi:hypothetical protein
VVEPSDHSLTYSVDAIRAGTALEQKITSFWNIADFGAKCEKCETINTITLEEGELKKQS